MPSLYYRIESPPGFTHTRALPRASIVGGAARRTWKLEAMRYAAAEHMTFYRPEFYARVLAPSGGELDDVFSSARAIVAGVPRGLMTPLAQRIAERLSASDVAALTDAVGKVREVNIARFRRDVDRTAVRVGFLFCRDFMATRDALRDVEPLAGAPTPVERLRAAVHFSVSDAYFKLRRQLGLALT